MITESYARPTIRTPGYRARSRRSRRAEACPFIWGGYAACAANTPRRLGVLDLVDYRVG